MTAGLTAALLIAFPAASGATTAAGPAAHVAASPDSAGTYNASLWHSINAPTGYDTVFVLQSALYQVAPGTGSKCISGGKVWATAPEFFDCLWVYKPVVNLAGNLRGVGLNANTAFPDALSMVCAKVGYKNESACIQDLLGPSWYFGIFIGSNSNNTLNYWFAVEATSYESSWYSCFVGTVGPSLTDPFFGFNPDADATIYKQLWDAGDGIIEDSVKCS
jgi:hypothetical protein